MSEWSSGFVTGCGTGLSVYLAVRLIVASVRHYVRNQRAAAHGDGPWIH